MKISKGGWATLILVILLGFLFACSSNNSTTKTIPSASSYPRIIQRAFRNERYLIMYSGVDTYRVTKAEVEKTKHQFTVHLARVDSVHKGYLRNPASATGDLIHMYMVDSTSYTLDEPHTIPMSKVARIERGN